jgi:cytochrome c peroxidase
MPFVNSIAFTTCNKLMKLKLNTFIGFLFPLLLAWQNYALATPILALPTIAETSGNPERNAFLPLPSAPDLSAEKVALGKRLFFEKRLSHDDTIACSSCHDFARGGADRLPVSIGIQGKVGQINAPTVFNSSLNFVQFWDGRAGSLEEQAAGPVHNALEMGANWLEVIPKLMADNQYRIAFASLYSEGISGNAIRGCNCQLRAHPVNTQPLR